MIQSIRVQAALLLAFGLAVSALAGCSESVSEPIPLRILVTNDDGVGAEGIDVVVEALRADANNDVTVCAPAVNQSGTSDRTDCATGNATDATTQSGYPATAVDGCPADAVNYALDPANGLYVADSLPHLVISGINQGQNVGAPIANNVSGTVGAARTAARDHDVPALASSQGLPIPDAEYDYDLGAEAVLAWLAKNRSALAAGNVTTDEVANLNIPSCATGEIRGEVEVRLAENGAGALDRQDCESTLAMPTNDIEGLNNGFITLSPAPAQ